MIEKDLYRPVRRNFVRRAVELKEMCDLYQADLLEMIPHARLNKEYKYLMTAINAFSQFAYTVPLKTKTGEEVAHALEHILLTNKMKPLQRDDGK